MSVHCGGLASLRTSSWGACSLFPALQMPKIWYLGRGEELCIQRRSHWFATDFASTEVILTKGLERIEKQVSLLFQASLSSGDLAGTLHYPNLGYTTNIII